jgi:hypothetical protein
MSISRNQPLPRIERHGGFWQPIVLGIYYTGPLTTADRATFPGRTWQYHPNICPVCMVEGDVIECQQDWFCQQGICHACGLYLLPLLAGS